VTPKDILRDEVFSKFVDPDHEAVLEDSKLLRQWDIPREPQPSKPVYTVTGARSVDSGMDHDCNVVGPEDYARANRFIHICPVLATKFTHTQLAAMPSDQVDKLVLDELARAHSAAPSAEDNNGVPEDTGKSLDTLRSVANQWVKDIVNSLIRKRGGEYRTDSPTARETYSRDISTIWNEAKARTGIAFTHIQDIQSIKQLKLLVDTLRKMHGEYV
jgi:hypothetical protein